MLALKFGTTQNRCDPVGAFQAGRRAVIRETSARLHPETGDPRGWAESSGSVPQKGVVDVRSDRVIRHGSGR
jgi:hypothetical protein